jgi:hypothetical protein
MKTSIKTIGLLAALVTGLTSPLYSQVPDLTKVSRPSRQLNLFTGDSRQTTS